jgi:UDP-glucose 4-epimerase/UDP-glucuronate 4-epimerase
VISDQPQRGPIPSYLLRALRGEAIREGGADFCASFTYVMDVVEALLAASSAPELRHAVYHFGHGVNFTARQAAAAVMKAVPGAVIELGSGTEPWTRYTALRGPLAGDRFVQDTGYAPSHTLDEGIAAYADWMRANPAAWRK